MTCHHNDRYGRKLRSKMGDGPHSVDLRHLHIAQDHINHERIIARLDRLNGLLTVLRLHHIVAGLGQDHLDGRPDMRFIINHENSAESHSPLRWNRCIAESILPSSIMIFDLTRKSSKQNKWEGTGMTFIQPLTNPRV